MIRLLIVGYGNPLRSDDGLGWHIAQRLSHEVSAPDVRVIQTQQLTLEIAEAANHAKHVLFIDARRAGPPGTLACEPISGGATARHTHEVSPSSVLKLAADLYGRAPSAHLLTITGDSFEAGESLSPAVVAAIPALMARLGEFLREAE
ncbi:MAG TPA: hydrogenase maturation protease [Candidatus Solibacter sp.]|nr:hydrogenase maturation protease [Candidatus Solibacter sp.]